MMGNDDKMRLTPWPRPFRFATRNRWCGKGWSNHGQGGTSAAAQSQSQFPFPFPAVGHIKMHNVSLFMALGASCVATTVKATNREAKTKREKERGREHYCAVLLLFPTAVTWHKQRTRPAADQVASHACRKLSPYTTHTHTHTAHPHTHCTPTHTSRATAFRGHCTDCSLAAVIAPAIARAYATRQIAELLHRTHTTTHFAAMPFTSTSPSSLLLLPLLPHNTNVSCFNSICW